MEKLIIERKNRSLSSNATRNNHTKSHFIRKDPCCLDRHGYLKLPVIITKCISIKLTMPRKTKKFNENSSINSSLKLSLQGFTPTNLPNYVKTLQYNCPKRLLLLRKTSQPETKQPRRHLRCHRRKVQ